MERRTEQGTRKKEQRTENVRARKGDDIAEGLLDAVERVRPVLAALEADPASKHVAKQLWRAATSGGAKYEEARSAESNADFVHKVRVATKELREAHYWMRVLQRSDWIMPGEEDGLVSEIDQLVAILVASARTAKSRAL
jgi:four helix bundle protein